MSGRAHDLAYQGPTPVGLILLGLSLAIAIWAIADAARRPAAVWAASGQNRVLWLALLVVGALFARLIGFGIAVYYLVVLRRKLQRASGEATEEAASE